MRFRDDDPDDRDEEPFGQIAPAGQFFGNPVASGAEFLFGRSMVDGQQDSRRQQRDRGSPDSGLFTGGFDGFL